MDSQISAVCQADAAANVVVNPWLRKHQAFICRLLLVPLFVAVCHIF